MKISFSVLASAASLFIAFQAAAAGSLRPPSVPLITIDPYLSIWSNADHLTDDVTRHWTGIANPLVSLIRVDGKTFRLMGNDPRKLRAFPQTALQVTPTRSIYEFDDRRVHVTLTFMRPALPDNLDVLTRPVTYITWAVKSVDGQKHAVSIYDSTSSALAVNVPENEVTWQREAAGPLVAMKTGAVVQTLFEPRGDGVRINWGYAYAAAPASQSTACIGGNEALIASFAKDGTLPPSDEAPPRAVKDHQPVMAFVFNLGPVGSDEISRHVMVAYDELYEVEFSGSKLLPFWKRNGATLPDLLQNAESDYPALAQKCQDFDQNLMADITTVGGEEYAQICALAYRQCLAGAGIAADANKQPLLFTKENTSNGDIATVDVLFPMNPMLLFLSPVLAKASVAPVLLYAASPRWKFPNAPHDLGTYPVASATGSAGEAMVVEESGNMIILCDAIAKADGNPDFCGPWWPQLTQWAKYLEQYGLDPGDQLCTDDFMGHLAHNSNLSVKAIVGLAAYGDLCRRRGDMPTAQRYSDLAQADEQNWVKMANDGKHYRLAFDKPGTWSQLYNLVWNKVLDLDAFPRGVAAGEIAFYKTKMNVYGLPLDSRTSLGDVDHLFFTSTLAESKEEFESFIAPFYQYLNRTTAHRPLVDTYDTKQLDSRGFHARPVVGGIFIRMLTDETIWKKWAAAGQTPVGPWATIQPLPILTTLLPAGGPHASFTWRYTTFKPVPDWNTPGFDDSAWTLGQSDAWVPPPTAKGAPAIKLPGVWIRTRVALPSNIPPNLEWMLKGRSDGEIYIDGVRAGTPSVHGDLEPQEIYPDAKALLQPGRTILIAAHLTGPGSATTASIGLGTAAWPASK